MLYLLVRCLTAIPCKYHMTSNITTKQSVYNSSFIIISYFPKYFPKIFPKMFPKMPSFLRYEILRFS